MMTCLFYALSTVEVNKSLRGSLKIHGEQITSAVVFLMRTVSEEITTQ